MNKTTIRLPGNLLTIIENRATQEGRSVSNIIRHTLSREFGVPCGPKLPLRKNPKLPGMP